MLEVGIKFQIENSKLIVMAFTVLPVEPEKSFSGETRILNDIPDDITISVLGNKHQSIKL